MGLFRHDGVFCPTDDMDFSRIAELFRERFFQIMVRRGKISPETVDNMKSWRHSGFHLDFQRKIEADDRKGLEGLLSYFERAPVSLKRLTYREDGMVHYQGTRFHPRLGIDHQLLTPVEFLAMLVPHVMLRYEVNIRLYGAISTTRRRKLGWVANPPTRSPPPRGDFQSPCVPSQQPPLLPVREPPKPTSIDQDDSQGDSQSEFLRNRKRNWAKLIAKVYQEDPSLCKSCGQPMEIIAAISSPAQDDVIERVLRHLNLWDPPWRRQRRARGPPRSHPQQAPFLQSELDFDGIDPQINTEDYCVDPPFPDEP